MTTATKNMKTKKGTRAAQPRAQKAAAPAPLTELPVYSREGKAVATVALPAELFGAPWKADLVHQVVTAMQANKRQNRAHTKDRSEVAGGGRKPWKQKGTGQARHGSSRSPIWRHGGVTFGPRNERDYAQKINAKMRAAALASVLSRKAKDGEVIFVEKLSFTAPKTKEAVAALSALAKAAAAPALAKKAKNAAFLALASHDASAIKSFRNIGNLAVGEARSLNPVEILAHAYLLIEDPEVALAQLTARMKK